MSYKRAIFTVVILLVAINLTLGIRWFVVSRSTPSSAPCANNLRQIESAKQQWAIEQHKSADAIPTWDDLQAYLRERPACPEGGTYTLGRIGTPPICSVGGSRHVYP